MSLQKELSSSLGGKVRRLYIDESSNLRVKSTVTLINWGCSNIPERLSRGNVLNKQEAVRHASNKLHAFNLMLANGSISIPPHTTSRATAEEWIADGKVVVCRTLLQGHSGAGITLAARSEELIQAPLYTQYIKKAQEYRVHVVFGTVIDIQQKRKRTDAQEGEINYAIRNYHTGWVYCRENIVEPAGLRDQAVLAVEQLDLDFGAVDIIYNSHYNKLYVLEVNTAPGLEGQTVTNYSDAFTKYLGEH